MRLHVVTNCWSASSDWDCFLNYGKKFNVFEVDELNRDITDLIFPDEVEEFLFDMFDLAYNSRYYGEYSCSALPVGNDYLESLFDPESYYSDTIRVAKFDYQTKSILLNSSIWKLRFRKINKQEEYNCDLELKRLEEKTWFIFSFFVREMARMLDYHTKNKLYYYHLTGADRQKAQWLEETIVRGVQRLYAEQFIDSKYTLMHIDMLNTGGLFKSEGFISADMLYQASSDCGLKIKDKTYEELLRTIICHSRDRYEDSYDYVRMLGRLAEIGPKKATNNGRLKWKI